MNEQDPRSWNISYSWTQPHLAPHWTDEINQLQLIMLAMEIMECDVDENDCTEAQMMLANIGIKC